MAACLENRIDEVRANCQYQDRLTDENCARRAIARFARGSEAETAYQTASLVIFGRSLHPNERLDVYHVAGPQVA